MEIILTDAPTYNGVQKQINQADLGLYRVLDVQRIKAFLFEHWDEISEIHLYKRGTRVGFEWLTKKKPPQNSKPDWVQALYGQIKAVLKVECDKEIRSELLENWEKGACTFSLTLIRVKKPEYVYEDLEEFLEGSFK